MFHFLGLNPHRVLAGSKAAPGVFRIHLGKLGPEEEDLRGIIDP